MALTNDWLNNDLPRTGQKFYCLPKHLPGRVLSKDFVYFIIDSSINPANYDVCITTLDTTNPGGMYRNLGPLRQHVELPFTQLDAYARLAVIPRNNPRLPRFHSRLSPGSTYVIPDVRGQAPTKGAFHMERRGVLRAGTDSTYWAY